jgi:NADH:ubiquinone oxidoreductase subunit F (NADH-binding)
MSLAPAGPFPAGPPAGRLPRILAGAPLEELASHVDHWGPLPRSSGRLIPDALASGLTGRGGAGFPVGRKLAAVLEGCQTSGRSAVVVANATEGEPGSAKDKTLLRVAPHLALDGAVATAGAVGADEVVVCVDRTSGRAVRSVWRAVSERARARVDPVSIRVEQTPDRYLSGQETALVHWLNGGEAKPTTIPPRPARRGVGGRPTLVSNVETLAHLALVARFGAAWYRQVGTNDEPGTALVTLRGAVAKPGVYEVAVGAPLQEVLDAAGGPTGDIRAVLLGGYYGSWVPSSALAAPLSNAGMRPWGGGLGAGLVAVLDDRSCGLAESARVARWLAAQSAGQCGPCANGLPAIAGALEAVAAGERSGGAHRQLLRWAAMVEGRGACHLPDGTARFVRSVVDVFAGDIEQHRRRGPCRVTPPVLPTPAPGPWR